MVLTEVSRMESRVIFMKYYRRLLALLYDALLFHPDQKLHRINLARTCKFVLPYRSCSDRGPMNENPEDMLARATPESIAAWSDDKKKQFCELFAQRVKASRYILRGIAHRVVNKTRTSFMLGQRKASELEGQFSSRHDFFDVQDNGRGYHHRLNTIGGRDYSELCEVIEERTKEIVRNLPPVVQAIEVIDKVTAERMRQRDDLVKECEELRDQLTEVCEPVSMKSIAETHPKTTLLEFLSMLDTKEQNRQRLVATITSKMTEGVRLESEISKAMYKGLPGLSEAIVEVVNGMLEQDKALDMRSRANPIRGFERGAGHPSSLRGRRGSAQIQRT
jgi:hypothetical protein